MDTGIKAVVVDGKVKVYLCSNGVLSSSYAQRVNGAWRVITPRTFYLCEEGLAECIDIMSAAMDTWYTAGEAADMLGVHRVTVCRWARDGRFPGAVRVGRGMCAAWRISRTDVGAMQQDISAKYWRKYLKGRKE